MTKILRAVSQFARETLTGFGIRPTNWAGDEGLGKKTIFRIEMTAVQDAGFSCHVLVDKMSLNPPVLVAYCRIQWKVNLKLSPLWSPCK